MMLVSWGASCLCHGVRTGQCVVSQLGSFLSVFWCEDWAVCCQSVGELPQCLCHGVSRLGSVLVVSQFGVFCRCLGVRTGQCVSRQLGSFLSVTGRELPQSTIFVATNAFVATKHVLCRNKSMLAATKIILVAAPANDRLDRLGSCRCLSVRTGECVGCQSVWSFLSVSWGEDWTMCCQSVGELPVGV